MKKISLALIALVILVTACKKNHDSANPNPIVGSNNALTATIAGSSWKPDFTYAVDSASQIYLIGTSGNRNVNTSASYLLLMIPDNISTGTTLNITDNSNSGIMYNDNSNLYIIGEGITDASGTITITKYDKSARRIEGSFNGVAKNVTQDGTSKNISNGQFAFNYK